MEQAPAVVNATLPSDESESPEAAPASANLGVAEDEPASVAVPSTQEDNIESPTAHASANPDSTQPTPASTPPEGIEEGIDLPSVSSALASGSAVDSEVPAALPTPPAPAAMPESGAANEAASADTLPPAEHASASSAVRPLVPSAISFTDVAIKYRLTAAKRLITIQLDEMKLLQQLSATKFKENDLNEVDVESFERPKGTPGLVVFTLTSQEVGAVGGDDDDDRLEASTHFLTGRSASMSTPPASSSSSDGTSALPPTDTDSASAASPSKPTPGSQEKAAAVAATAPVRTSWANRMGSYVVGAARTVATNRSLSSSYGSSHGGGDLEDGEGGAAGGAYTRTKHFQFKTPEEADAFVECLCLAKALGPALRGAFMALDVNRNGTVDAPQVMRAASSVKLRVTLEEAENMVALGDVGLRGRIDFAAFFNLFLEGPIPGGFSAGWAQGVAAMATERVQSTSSATIFSPSLQASQAELLLPAVLSRWLVLSAAAQAKRGLPTGSPTLRPTPSPGTSSSTASGKGGMHPLDAAFAALLLPGERLVQVLDRARWGGESMGVLDGAGGGSGGNSSGSGGSGSGSGGSGSMGQRNSASDGGSVAYGSSSSAYSPFGGGSSGGVAGSNGSSDGTRELHGVLRVTTFRLSFTRYQPHALHRTTIRGRRHSLAEAAAPQGAEPLPLAFEQAVHFPLASLARAELVHRLGQPTALRLTGKDTRVVRITLVASGSKAIEQLSATVRSLAFPGSGPQGSFAFKYLPHGASTGANRDGDDGSRAAAPATNGSSNGMDKDSQEGSPTAGQYPNRWDLFDPAAEYARIGFFNDPPTSRGGSVSGDSGEGTSASSAEDLQAETAKGWRLYRQDFSPENVYSDGKPACLSPTYPEAFVMPASLSDAQIALAASHRSKARVPAATWMDPITGAVLVRASQPFTGVGNKRCAEDVLLLEAMRVANGRGGDVNVANNTNSSPESINGNSSSGVRSRASSDNGGIVDGDISAVPSNTGPPLFIADCRGKVAVQGNQLQGKGVEDVRHHTNTQLFFCDVLNIHTMRDSQAAFIALLSPDPLVAAAANSYGGPTAAGGTASFHKKLDECGWLKHVSLVLSSAVWAARKLRLQGASVLCHCSDGWDRTAQTCTLAQLLLDPYYRTLEGFAVLVEKDWLSFGHKFQERCAHTVDESGAGATERSPIFVQWLECVQHVVAQAPAAFEFNEAFLVFLADALFSCLFGTFLGNTDRERAVELRVKERTASVWSYALSKAAQSKFVNPAYVPERGPVWPQVAVRDLAVWKRYYLRHCPDAHPHRLSGVQWLDDFGTP